MATTHLRRRRRRRQSMCFRTMSRSIHCMATYLTPDITRYGAGRHWYCANVTTECFCGRCLKEFSCSTPAPARIFSGSSDLPACARALFSAELLTAHRKLFPASTIRYQPLQMPTSHLRPPLVSGFEIAWEPRRRGLLPVSRAFASILITFLGRSEMACRSSIGRQTGS